MINIRIVTYYNTEINNWRIVVERLAGSEWVDIFKFEQDPDKRKLFYSLQDAINYVEENANKLGGRNFVKQLESRDEILNKYYAALYPPFGLIIEERVYLDGSKKYFIKPKHKKLQIKIDETHPYANYNDAKFQADKYYKEYKKITCDEIIEHEYKPE